MSSVKYKSPYNKPLPIPRANSKAESSDMQTDKIIDSSISLPESQLATTSASSTKSNQTDTCILSVEDVLKKFILSTRKQYISGSNKNKTQLETEEFLLAQLENIVKRNSLMNKTFIVKDQAAKNLIGPITDFFANISSKIYNSNLLSITQTDNTPTIMNYSFEDLQKILCNTKYSFCDESISGSLDLEVKDDSSLSSDGTMTHRSSIKNKSNKKNSIMIQNARVVGPLSFTYNLNPNYIDIKPYPKISKISNNQIFIRIKNLILYENLEPMFASIALYNVNLKKKVTETISIDISSKDNLYLNSIHNLNYGSESNSFLFSRGEHPIEDLYLFIRFEKILAKGSLAKVMTYYETQNHDSKNINKAKASAIKVCENLSSFKMPLGWIYFPLAEILTNEFNIKTAKFPRMKIRSMQSGATESALDADTVKNVASDTQSNSFEFIKNVFNRAEDGDMNQDFPYKIIAESKTFQSHNKKNHVFYGTLDMEIFRIPSVTPNNCFDSSNIPLLPSNNIPENIFKPTDIVTKLDSFSSSKHPICHQKIINRLYLYPVQLNCSQRPNSAKSFQVLFFLLEKELTELNDLERLIKTKSNQMQSTAVQYHCRMPNFYEEMKFDLSRNIDKNFHILVVVRSITITKLLIPSINIIGYSWIPLFKNDCINNGYFELPLSSDILPSLYSKHYPMDCSLPIKWLDSKKPLIGLRLKLVSSLYTKSPNLRSSFPKEPMSNDKKKSTTDESSLSINSSFLFYSQAIEILKNLSSVKPKVIIDHFYFISNYILSLIDTLMPADITGVDYEKCKKESAKAFYQLTDCVATVALNSKSMQDDIGRNNLLGAYTTWFSLNKKINFAYIKSDIPVYAAAVAMSISSTQSENARDFENLYKSIAELIILSSKESCNIVKIMKYPWFYFELIIKSLLIAWSNKPKSETTRFACHAEFIDMLFPILDIFINHIHSLIKMNLIDNILFINASLSRFLLDLYFIIDRGVVIGLLSLYIKKICIENNEASRIMQISTLSCFICNEKVLAADLAAFDMFRYSVGEKNFHQIYLNSIEDIYEKNLFIFPILINEIKYSLNETAGSTSFELLINSTIRMICRFECIDSIKYPPNKSQEEVKLVSPLLNYIACIMFPIIYQIFIIVAQHTLREENSSSILDNNLPSLSGTGTVKINKKLDFQSESKIMNIINISGIKTLQGLFFIFIWIVRAVHSDLLLQSWKHFSAEDKLTCVDTLLLCLQIFPYSETPESSISLSRGNLFKRGSQVGTLSKMDILKELILNGPTKMESRREPKSQAGQYRNFIKLAKTQLKGTIDLDLKTAQIMKSYLNIISNETIFYFLSMILNETESKIDKQPILAKCLEVLTKLLMTKQTIILHTNVLICLQIYIKKFSVILFESSSEICANLVGALVTLCKSPFGDIRENSSEILFVMLKMNFKVKKNLSRMTYMITSAIFNSISNEMKNVFTSNLQNSLNRIISYSLRNNKYLINQDIYQIFQNLISILKDTTKISEMNNHLYSKIDHMHGIITRLGPMPDLRIHWLLQISDILLAKEYFLQAALCVLQASIVSFGYICSTSNKLSYLPYGLSIFKNITSNYDDEYFDFSESSNSVDDQIYSKKYLTQKGFITLINLCISIFTKAKAYNYIISLIDIVYRSYQSNNQYQEAAKFTEIHVQSLNSMEKQGTINDTCAYFRVAFYGEKCEILNNAEFIYAEPPHTKLSQFFDSIKYTYSQIFPTGSLEIIMDSAPVDKEKLNPSRCYIQITFVSPYVSTTYSENYTSDNQYAQDYRYFYYVTPFTISGKARGDILDQYQRINILEVEKFFPCTLVRQKIISCREEIISPIDVMISDMGKRARDLQKVLMEFPLDLKILQLNLQGCINATVNQGPFEAAKIFLEPFISSDIVYTTLTQENLLYFKSINSLQLTCQFLLNTCKQALLSVEATEIPADNMEYWDCMGELYNKFNGKLSILLNNVKDKLKRICIN